MDLEDLCKDEGLFEDSYMITKKKEDDLQSAIGLGKIGQKRKFSSKVKEVNKVDETMIRKKGLGELQKIKLNSNTTSKHVKVENNTPATSFASLVPQNVKLVYLRRGLVQKLVKQPETFEDKVKGTFVRVELPRDDVSKMKAHQLVQVTGATKISNHENNVDIKLQALNVPNDISIDMLSDASFLENEVEVLKQQVKVGLLKKPTMEEFEQKARSLHEDMIDDFIDKELRRLQPRIDQANEKGRRREYFRFITKKKLLQAPSERMRLLVDLPEVIADVSDFKAVSEEILNDRVGKETPEESIPINDTLLDNDKFASAGASAPADVHVRKQVKEARPPLPLTTETKEESEQQLIELKQNKDIQEQKGKGKRMAIEKPVEPFSNNRPEEEESICSISTPRAGAVVTPVHHNPSMMPLSNHQFCTSMGLDISDPPQFNGVAKELVKEAGLPCGLVWDHYTDKELFNFANRYKTQFFAVMTEILLRAGKIFKEHKRFDAMHQKLDMIVFEANKKINMVKDELKRLEDEDKMVVEATKKITSVEEELGRHKVKMEEEANNNITILDNELKRPKFKMEENALISATNLEEKFDDTFEQHVKQKGEVMKFFPYQITSVEPF